MKAMQFINALSLTANVNIWLANSRHLRILHVFDHACNLINERREILSIVTPQIGNGPFNLVVEDHVLFPEYINIESPVSIVSNQIMLSDRAIHTTNAKLWNARPDWEKLHVHRDNILNQLMKFSITDGAFSTSLFSALVNADLSTSITAAKQLAGLGQGLTPAGDDFLLGAIYAAWIIHPPEICGMLANAIAATAAPLTTSLSAAWLRSAGKGEAGILWHQFFDVLISANPARIQEAMDKILAVGETSGADAMAGFIGLFMCWGEHCSNLWEYNQT
jgi:hypothetical protein